MMRNPRMAVIAAAVMLFTTCVSVVPSSALVGPTPIKDWTIGEPNVPNGGRAMHVPIGRAQFSPFIASPSVLSVPIWFLVSRHPLTVSPTTRMRLSHD
jgi:hypothetical protein